jgi:hypothetical protein
MVEEDGFCLSMPSSRDQSDLQLQIAVLNIAQLW